MSIWVVLAAGILTGGVLASLIFGLMLGKWYVGNLQVLEDPDEPGPHYFMAIARGRAQDIRIGGFVLLRVKGEER